MRSQIFWVRVEMFWTDVNESGEPGRGRCDRVHCVMSAPGVGTHRLMSVDTDVVQCTQSASCSDSNALAQCRVMHFLSHSVQTWNVFCSVQLNLFWKTKYRHAPFLLTSLAPSLRQPLEGFVFYLQRAGVRQPPETTVFDQTHYQSSASEIREGTWCQN